MGGIGYRAKSFRYYILRFSIIIIMVVVLIQVIHFSSNGLFNGNSKNLHKVGNYSKRFIYINTGMQDHFRLHWHRERKLRVDWLGILKPCFHNREWGKVNPGWEKSERSNASTSVIVSEEIRPAREYSRLFIQSKTKDSRKKTFGGDTWRVYLRGPASISATLFDHNNGTYEALFLVMEPGEYRLEIYLDYSLCNGFRDPPIDWFIKGTAHGRSQKDGSLGELDDFLHQTFPGNHSIFIKQPRLYVDIQSILLPSPNCKEYCTFLHDGYGRWINGKWAPFIEAKYNESNAVINQTSGVVMSYGDSLALRFGTSMAANPNVRKVYQSATYKYNWVYPVGDETQEKLKDDDLDFDSGRVISYIKNALNHPSINTEHSTLVMNIGLHYIRAINFTTYQALLENFLDLIFVNQSLESPGTPRYRTNTIWKSTTQIKKELSSNFQDTGGRFFTSQRVLLFNAYATWRMCRAGIPVVDVLPITPSFLPGPLDVVHYPHHVFKQAEDTIASFKRFHNNNKNEINKTCIS